MESLKLFSRFEAPELQLRDTQGSIICSPHATTNEITWRHVVFCTWRKDQWTCNDARTLAEFYVQGKKLRIDYSNWKFTESTARKLFGDIFGFGSTGRKRISLEAKGPCELDKWRVEPYISGPTEAISLICVNKIFGIDEHCSKAKCRYSSSYSFERK